MLGGADTSTPWVDQEQGAGVELCGGLRGVSLTSLMPVILSLDFSCAQASGGKAIAPAASAAEPVKKSRRFISLSPSLRRFAAFWGSLPSLLHRHQPDN